MIYTPGHPNSRGESWSNARSRISIGATIRTASGRSAVTDPMRPERALGGSRRWTSSNPTSGAVEPGWLADGVPIDVFKSAPAAYRNRLEFLERE